MKRYLVVIILPLFVLLLGAVANPALAVPLGVGAGSGDLGFAYAASSVAVNYDSDVGFGFGVGFYTGDSSGIFVEGGEGSFGVGAWFELAENLVLAAKYEHATGWTYTWYGWEYVEIDGFLAGAYYIHRGGGLSRGKFADRNAILFGGGFATATDGYVTDSVFFLECQSVLYVGENVAFTTALSYTDEVLVSTLGLVVGF